MIDKRYKRTTKTKHTASDARTAQADMRRPIPEWLAVKLDIPSQVLTGGMSLELRGRNTLLVHGCHRILTYSPEEMRLALHGCTLCVTGERLICTSYMAGAVGIDGRIVSLSFAEGEEEGAC